MEISRRAITMTGVCVGLFLAALDVSIVATALPTMVADLGGLASYTWVISAYLLASTTGGPVFGKLSDLFGRKNLFLIGIGIFLVGSVLCGQARSMEQLIAFRALQGLGGGAIFALSLTIAGVLFAETERARMMAIVSSVWAMAALVGPFTGGVIVDHVGWRWVFYVNLPVGAIAMATVVLALAEPHRVARRQPRIDFAGIAAFATAVVALLIGVLQGGVSWDWISAPSFGLFGLAIVALIALIAIERRAPEPLLPLPLFRLRTVSVGNAGNFLTGAALFGASAFIPLFIQGVLGRSATEAGAVLTPMSLGWPAGGLIGGQILNRLGYRSMALGGAAFMTVGFLLMTLATPASSIVSIVIAMFLVGLGMGLISPTLLTAIQNSVPDHQIGIATSTAQFFRTTGGVIGVGVLGAILTTRLNVAIDRLIAGPSLARLPPDLIASFRDPQVLLDLDLRGRISETVLALLREALAEGLNGAYLASFAIACLVLALAAAMPNRRPGDAASEEPAVREASAVGSLPD